MLFLCEAHGARVANFTKHRLTQKDRIDFRQVYTSELFKTKLTDMEGGVVQIAQSASRINPPTPKG